MTVSLLHTKVSGKPAGTDPTRVYGTHWDAEHALIGAANTLLGFNSSGAATEITLIAPRVVTSVNVTILVTDTIVVINKVTPSATVITLPAVATFNPNVVLEIYDWLGTAGDMTIVANGSEMIMGSASSWTVASGGVAQSGGSLRLVPCSAIGGWLVR